MSAGIPPSLGHPIITTPADEWANQTSDAIGSKEAIATGGVRAVAHDINQQPPGAYPEDLASEKPTEDTVDSALGAAMVEDTKKAAHEVVEMAKELLPAQETAAQYLPTPVMEVVAPYLPSTGSETPHTTIASEHDRPHERSLPSQEDMGMQPHEHVAGAGSLPGSASEAGVAKLPDERTPGSQSPTSRPGPAASSGTSTPGSPAQKATENLPAVDPGVASLPSKEKSGTEPSEKVGGVGALPGGRSESGVAVLPEERQGGGTGAAQEPYGAAQAPNVPAFKSGMDTEGLHLDEDRGPIQQQQQPSGDDQKQEKSVTAKAGEVKDRAEDAAKDKVKGGEQVRHGPPQANLQPREWKTWQGLDNGHAPRDFEMADTSVGSDPDSEEMRREAVDRSESQHADAHPSSPQDRPPQHPRTSEPANAQAQAQPRAREQ
ncbi:hypothetical protein EWM64_g636 [Hericium alpestre]|uniref:Uncharacterized protein n=1 Tax=Hericium alpestre TaxID=135208 RepID=A0A4Z0AA09_9AGAM|nr:hypothetical protein EWM64_g636 [Hericium alpestre]